MTSHTQPISSTPRMADDRKGLLLGLTAVAMFSLTLPFTRLAVAELPPAFVALGRALVAACLAALWLWHQRAPLPRREQWLPLALVALGCVVGFPWLTSIAMRSLPASHGAVLVGILPLATAVFAVLRGKERPSTGFWLMALAGTALVVLFALRQGGGSFHLADVLMFAAVILGALGYAEGGRLAQSMPGQHVISWALVLAAPFVLPLVLYLTWPQQTLLLQAGATAWLGFAYISVFSMFIGFFFWYRGMALGGVARVGQTQLLQPFLTLLGAAVLLGEALELASLLFAGAVIAVVAAGRKLK
ncbi:MULTISPECIES: DMT family transporter [unclassified Janthinobacterium]|uniref:DMT family transporter n=1 Tax=unclassified Janthinobacterium TaxID=2610881 RepID=UPI00161AF31C|nr:MULTISPECIES: DMT family transporter [unclassified Janthinobacterium]MBB5369123.1 drug/metabolite transporter (DMT)-like permease [Janthinobacterium sp. K2C7]MBB5381340.1 drug/metabolite transporter (DMT)-like permease [Janthinobacterium sp. K2Li3]MBB5387506.1 drug/metabolite transporter (DMT)-like permease [Janthinobacterium sp. K2E3]